MKSLHVIKSGIFTLIQDSGRYGFMDKGITQSGVMDNYSYDWLNKLLQNEKNSNCLEIAFGNIELNSTVDTFIAVTGAKCEFFINDILKENWKVYKIKAGDSIKIGKIISGQRVYLGVKGGFCIDCELNSVSTTIKESIGGLNGGKLVDGDILPCDKYKTSLLSKVPNKFIPNYDEQIVLRTIASYQYESFSKEQRDMFFSNDYTITPSFDRMGCKLKGEVLRSTLDGIVSEAISFGSVQIPSDGQPIVLLKDRQTIGGYPKIGTVIPQDCYKLSQGKAGQKVRFKLISLEEAVSVFMHSY